jgi:bifunctional non-homologous end joining protein LigD
MQEKSTYLFNTEGSANKEYHAHLRKQGDGWMVQYANGPRGKVGQSKNKFETPLTFEQASCEFDKLVKSKMKTGYTEDESGVRFTNTEHAASASGHLSQQPMSIGEDDANAMVHDRDWCLQEKANGENRPVQITSESVRGINKLGLFVNVPETWVEQFRCLGDCHLDGEHVGETLYVYDATRIAGRDIRHRTFMERYAILEAHLDQHASTTPSLKILRPATTHEGKRAALDGLRAANREGVVFKHVLSSYESGKNRNTLKFKFLESSTFIVVKKNQQRSVEIGLLNSRGVLIPRGNVTIPANQEVPEVDDQVEVMYLYFNPGGAFEQPTYLGKRNDIAREECTHIQITRIKPEMEMDADGEKLERPRQMESPRP